MNNPTSIRIPITLLLLTLSLATSAQQTTPYIVVDQFGYLPDSKKVAVIRDPQTGFDAAESFTPGSTYAVIKTSDASQVYTGTPVKWKNGTTDASSGDKAWWFDFSSVIEDGSYYILDIEKDVRSFEFEISGGVYNDLLKQAVRVFFYQRAGFPKKAPFADIGWEDEASHIDSFQDKNARAYNRKTDATSEKDVSGGWYDAGDYNKYTSWTANYVTDMMHAYLENPGVWGDDYNIPESGNGVPDLLDEAKWGIDHLLRMQNEDGSVLSIVGLAHASPPSSATGASYYGTASTSATLNSSAAFAFSSKVFVALGQTDYATTLREAAISAWNWAEANPSVLFYNNDASQGTSGLGSGQQEVDDYGRLVAKIEAAIFLYALTGETSYKTFMESNYEKVHLIEWGHAYAFETTNQDMLLYYSAVEGASPSVAADIRDTYKASMNSGTDNFPAITSQKDPYLAPLQVYTWGSNSIKGGQGTMFYHYLTFGLDASKNELARETAENYIHYLHGVNPLNLVYLSNMYAFGGDNCVNEFYHTWFGDGSAKWDRVGESTYGPAPGFVTGGPNPSYDWDGCCPSGCGSAASNSVCTSMEIAPPKGQPEQKSYKDFNTSWPLNSWSVTENSNGYQLSYIRLLSKFADPNYDCSGTKNGTASIDACGVCSGGTTGIEPQTDPEACNPPLGLDKSSGLFRMFPNPANESLTIESSFQSEYRIQVLDISGKTLLSTCSTESKVNIDLHTLSKGQYLVILEGGNKRLVEKLMKN